MSYSLSQCLSEPERASLVAFFQGMVNFQEIKILRLGRLAARTVGNTIFFPRGLDMHAVENRFLLCHEIGHVWQYQHWGLDYIPCALGEQAAKFLTGHRKEIYHFDLLAGKALRDYPIEQQANLIACAYAYQRLDGGVALFRNFCNNWQQLDKLQTDGLVEAIRQQLLLVPAP